MKKKNKAVKITCIVIVVAAVLTGGYFLIFGGSQTASASEVSFSPYTVSKGDISVTVNGSGSIQSANSTSVNAACDMEAVEVLKSTGDDVKEGDVLAVFKSDTLDTTIDELKTSIAAQEVTVSTFSSTTGDSSISSPAKGRVKEVAASAGDDVAAVMKNKGYLCVLSTDGRMKTTFTTNAALTIGDEVTVKVESYTHTGTVQDVSEDGVTVTINDDTYDVGSEAVILDSDGNELGKGTLAINKPVNVVGSNGTISSKYATYNKKVYVGSTLFTLKGTLISKDFEDAMETLAGLEDDLHEAEAKKESLTVTAASDGVLSGFDINVGDKILEGSAIYTLQSDTNFNLVVAIDELDIAGVKPGQSADITIDALPDNTFTGTVNSISKIGSNNSNVTTYDVTLSLDNSEGVMAGMNASADIKVNESLDTLLVPVEAIQTINNEKFVMAYDENAGTETDTDSATPDQRPDTSLMKPVETGLSDGTFTEILSGLNEGDAITVPKTSTSGENDMMMMGGMMGGMGGQAVAIQRSESGGPPSSGSGQRPPSD